MPDDTNIPVEPTPAAPQPENWEARFKGQVRTIEQLTLRNRDLEAQLAARTQELEQARAQLTAKDTEKNVAVAERDKQIQDAITGRTSVEKELAELRAYKLKVETIRKMGKPQLLRILDTIPAMSDETALNTVITNLAQFTDEIAQERERQILAGVTPQGSGSPKNPTLPSSDEAWMSHINALPLGSPERGKAFDEYWSWLEASHSK